LREHSSLDLGKSEKKSDQKREHKSEQ